MEMTVRVRPRARQGIQRMCADEQRAFVAALDAACGLKSVRDRELVLMHLERVAAARGRVDQRRVSDARTDTARRVTVGARIRREDAERCTECAARDGMSLYRFVWTALMDACERSERAGITPVINSETAAAENAQGVSER